jgi:NAD(P) transhydrogenase subunit alpha
VRVVVPKETVADERRVALVPEAVGRLRAAGFEVVVESGVGVRAFQSDEAYRAAGAVVRDGDVLGDADVVLSVQLGLVRVLAERGVSSFSVELVPRISRAQSMDALSSQALVAGYRAALVAAERLPRFLPMFMTAAGTVAPATVLVLGAGVAGLQAISTARRLGAVVQAYDVRAAAAEEVRSLGARFVELDLEVLEGAGGYAREMSEDRAVRQQELLAPFVAGADALITTAAVPGRPAPLLVTAVMVEGMKPGSVVVDLAAESGGNVEGSKPGEEVWRHGVLVWGAKNAASQLPVHASQLYARNLVNLLLLMSEGDQVRLDFDDEIVAGCCVTHAGAVRHAPTAALIETNLRV